MAGAVGYAITDEGREALAGKKPRKPRWLPEPDDKAFDSFMKFYRHALADRETWRTQKSHVLIPLSCGLWPEVATTGVTARGDGAIDGYFAFNSSALAKSSLAFVESPFSRYAKPRM